MAPFYTKKTILLILIILISTSYSCSNGQLDSSKSEIVKSLQGFDSGRISFREVYGSFNGRVTDSRDVEMRLKFKEYGGEDVIQDSSVHLLKFSFELIDVDLSNTSPSNRTYYGNSLRLNLFGVSLQATDDVTISQQFYYDNYNDGFILDKYKDYEVTMPILKSNWDKFENTINDSANFTIVIRGFKSGPFYEEKLPV